MIRLLMILTYIAGGVGVAVGFYLLGRGSGHGEDALIAVTIGFCVVMGGLSWVRHFLLWRADEKFLGVHDATPFFHWEVGFANGAFALAGFLAVIFAWGVAALAAVVLCYAVYLLQAAVMHGWRYFSGRSRTPQRLWGSFIGLLAICVMVIVIVAMALGDAGIRPF